MTTPPNHPSLLLVEDDETEAARLESALGALGYRCTHAANGDAALTCLRHQAFDIVLLDLVLPELDGMGLLQAMTAQGMDMPVVVAVTPAGMDGAANAIRAGAADFVVKPAGALRLQVALANALALKARMPETANARPPAPTSPDDAFPTLPHTGQDGHLRPLDAIEADLIRLACARYEGRLSEVARRLGIGRSTLYRKLAQLESQPCTGGAGAKCLPSYLVAAE
ncbi:response regulator [Xanthobacter sp. TB0139]|uniref:response regulator n=1 Tax=Xanthobacter sp. TB0139 TaxID=3459178 RepID=UPI00403A71FF